MRPTPRSTCVQEGEQALRTQLYSNRMIEEQGHWESTALGFSASSAAVASSTKQKCLYARSGLLPAGRKKKEIAEQVMCGSFGKIWLNVMHLMSFRPETRPTSATGQRNFNWRLYSREHHSMFQQYPGIVGFLYTQGPITRCSHVFPHLFLWPISE